MNSRTSSPDWEMTIELEKEIANILTTKGRVTEADEIRRLKRDLARVTEERDILKKATAYFARESR